MRILFLTHRLPYAPNRGDRIRAFHLARVLSQQHEVHLVSFIHDEEEGAHLEALRPTLASVTGVTVQRKRRLAAGVLSLPSATPLTHVLLHDPSMPRVLAEVRARTSPQVTLAYCSGMARYAMEPPLRDLPWVLDMLDVDSAKWAALGTSGRAWLRPIYRREARLLGEFELRAIQSAAATAVVSEKERTTLRRLAPERPVHLVGNGIDVVNFAPQSGPADTPEVVFCGVFNYEPNATAAIWLAEEIWPLVRRTLPEATLSLVGMSPTPAVSALAAPGVRVTGAVPDVRPYLWSAAIGVAPLRVARGVQNKVLEALAAGLPCIVTPAVWDGLPPVARAGCASAADAASFAAAIVERLRMPAAQRRRLAQSAQLEQLSWSSQLAPMADLLADAAKH